LTNSSACTTSTDSSEQVSRFPFSPTSHSSSNPKNRFSIKVWEITELGTITRFFIASKFFEYQEFILETFELRQNPTKNSTAAAVSEIVYNLSANSENKELNLVDIDTGKILDVTFSRALESVVFALQNGSIIALNKLTNKNESIALSKRSITRIKDTKEGRNLLFSSN
jgi:hypothetical protein